MRQAIERILLSRHRFHLAQKANAMLVLSRKPGERIVIGPNVEVTVVDISGNKVRLAIDAPRDVSIHREEIYLRIQDESRHEVQREHADSP
jgi:carbon storage regulator